MRTFALLPAGDDMTSAKRKKLDTDLKNNRYVSFGRLNYILLKDGRRSHLDFSLGYTKNGKPYLLTKLYILLDNGAFTSDIDLENKIPKGPYTKTSIEEAVRLLSDFDYNVEIEK